MFVITVIRYNSEGQKWLGMEYYACKITFLTERPVLISSLYVSLYNAVNDKLYAYVII